MYNDGELTTIVKNHIIDGQFGIDEKSEDLLAYITEISEAPLFSDGIREICATHGYDGDLWNDVAVRKFIVKNAKVKQIINTDKEIKSFDACINNWFKAGAIWNDNADSRLNVYRMCFSLSMSVTEIEEFFLKKYLYRPFNLRNLRETVFFYALNNSKDYLYANNLYERICDLSTSSRIASEEDPLTCIFKADLESITDEEDFIEYCKLNANYFNQNNATAIKFINTLLDDCFDFLADEYYEDNDVKKISYLLRTIYGGEPSYYNAEIKKWIKGVSSNDILKELKKCAPRKISTRMPSEEEMSKIRTGKPVGSDAVRKMLIILDFYNFFMLSGDDNTDDLYDDFIVEMDSVLNECGFIQSYARNPFDWIFMYCAKQIHPIESFQAILHEFISIPNDN